MTNQNPKILFVCDGNVGRSQMAEAYYNYYTQAKNTRGGGNALSAGVDPTTPVKYIKPTDEVIIAMRQDGLDVSKNNIKLLTPEMIEPNDMIVVICDHKRCPSFLLESKKPLIFWQIKDPYQMSFEFTIEIRDQVKAKVLELIKQIKQNKIHVN